MSIGEGAERNMGRCKTFVLSYTILFALVAVVLDFVLSFFKLMFREWIVIGSAVIIMAGLVIGTVQLLLKIKKKVVKGILQYLLMLLNMLLKEMGKSLLPM